MGEDEPKDQTEPTSVVPQNVCTRIHQSLFHIRSYFGGGTGFAVHRSPPEGGRSFVVVATAHHVVEQAMRARAEIVLEHSVAGKSYIANPARYGIDRVGDMDVAFCFIDGTDEEFSAVQVVKQAPEGKWLSAGSRVLWMGFPGLVMHFAQKPIECVFAGIVSGSFMIPGSRTANAKLARSKYVLDGTVLPGCSGGPAFAEAGEVIGVVVEHGAERNEAGIPMTGGVTLAVPLWEALREYLEPDPTPPPA